jgi:hypothetical protein
MPLILPQRKLIARPGGPFAFPGTQPGFNPSHPAAAKPLFSGVSMGGNFINLGIGAGGGARGTIVGSPTPKILPSIGLATLFVASASVQFSFPATNFTNYTIAAIVNWLGTNAASQDIAGNDTSSGGVGTDLGLSSTGVVSVRLNAVSVASTLPALVANASYLIAASGTSASGANMMYARLDTGQIFSQFVSSGTSTTANGTLTIGNVGDASRFFNGSIATAMYSNSFLSLAQLTQWAADPWSFWYPK